VTSSWANTNVRDQLVSQFATKAARDSAITSPVAGMLAYTADLQAYSWYSGSSWAPLSGPMLISRQTLGADTATVTFSSRLQPTSDDRHGPVHRRRRQRLPVPAINGDTAGNYDWATVLWNDLTSPTTATAGSNGVAGTSLRISPVITGATEVASCFSQTTIDILHYADTTNRMKGAFGATASRGFVINLAAGQWIPASATAITSVSVAAGAGSLKAGSILSPVRGVLTWATTTPPRGSTSTVSPGRPSTGHWPGMRWMSTAGTGRPCRPNSRRGRRSRRQARQVLADHPDLATVLQALGLSLPADTDELRGEVR
jgi:hypothetical protein